MQNESALEKEAYSEKLEQAFVELVAERVEARGWKKIEFAAQVWPRSTRKAASSKWSDIRGKATNTGKPQSIGLAEAIRMAQVVGYDLNYLMVLAQEKVRGDRLEKSVNNI